MSSRLKGLWCFSTASRIKSQNLEHGYKAPAPECAPTHLPRLISDNPDAFSQQPSYTALPGPAFLPSAPWPLHVFLSLLAWLIMFSPSEESLCVASLENVLSDALVNHCGSMWLSFRASHSVCRYSLADVKTPTGLSVL